MSLGQGRPPIPTHLKIIRGNPGKRAINKREPKPLGDLYESPNHFDQETRDVWDYAIQHAPKGLLKKIDGSVLEAWCAAHVTHRRALQQIQKFGVLVKSPKQEVPMQSPWVAVLNKQAIIMMRACEHLGFSPASRTRIALGEGPAAVGGWDEVSTG